MTKSEMVRILPGSPVLHSSFGFISDFGLRISAFGFAARLPLLSHGHAPLAAPRPKPGPLAGRFSSLYGSLRNPPAAQRLWQPRNLRARSGALLEAQAQSRLLHQGRS